MNLNNKINNKKWLITAVFAQCVLFAPPIDRETIEKYREVFRDVLDNVVKAPCSETDTAESLTNLQELKASARDLLRLEEEVVRFWGPVLEEDDLEFKKAACRYLLANYTILAEHHILLKGIREAVLCFRKELRLNRLIRGILNNGIQHGDPDCTMIIQGPDLKKDQADFKKYVEEKTRKQKDEFSQFSAAFRQSQKIVVDWILRDTKLEQDLVRYNSCMNSVLPGLERLLSLLVDQSAPKEYEYFSKEDVEYLEKRLKEHMGTRVALGGNREVTIRDLDTVEKFTREIASEMARQFEESRTFDDRLAQEFVSSFPQILSVLPENMRQDVQTGLQGLSEHLVADEMPAGQTFLHNPMAADYQLQSMIRFAFLMRNHPSPR